MASNKFATVLNRETNRITLVLVYAVLEWTLIIFLLLNSLFSYLIIKFANYFGLKPPCLLCSRLDQVFEAPNSKSSYRDLICEHHAIELSRSGYCSNHRKLVESQDMCEDCWSSHHGDHQHPTAVLAFRWLNEMGMGKSDENCDVNLRCSCCGVEIKNEVLAPLSVTKPSLGVLKDIEKFTRDKLVDDVVIEDVLESSQEANIDELPLDNKFHGEQDQNGRDSLDIEGNGEDGNGRSRDIQMGPYSNLVREDNNLEGFSFCLSKEGYSLVEAHKEVVLEAESEPLLKSSSASVSYPYANEKIIPQHLEFYIDFDDYQLIPVDFSDLEMERSKGERNNAVEENQKNRDQEKFNELWRETDEGLVLEPDNMVPTAALDAVDKITSSLDFLELYETKSEELSTKLTPAQEMTGEFDTGAESDEARDEVLPIKKDQKAEELKSEAGAALIIGEHKVEILPTINSQVEVTTKEIAFHVTGGEHCDALLTFNGDQISNEIEVTKLDVNVVTSDFEDAYHKQSPLGEMMEDSDIGVESDEAKVEGLPFQKDQESEEMKREVGSGVIHEHKVEIFPNIESQEEVTEKEIDFHVGDDEIYDALLTFNGDQVMKAIEVTEFDSKIPTSEFEDVYHQENDEVDVVRSIESLDKGEVSESEPLKSSEDKFPSSNDDVICEASTISNALNEIRDYAPMPTDEQIHMGMPVEITERELQIDVALSQEPNEVGVDLFYETANPADSLHHLHEEILDDIATNELNNNEGFFRVEEHKAQMESERKILQALDADLEEEKSAAAVATNETSEVELDSFPEAANPSDTVHHFHEKILDDSNANELNNGEGVVRVEELKSQLESERKILRALYAELEEERSAAAVATNETMAMINRLQEEKATIEMEASQYQRMMEEQCEYDQEALQLMNEMLVKREKQLQELETELEVCHKKVIEYEEREKLRLLSLKKDRSFTKSRTSSASCSNGEESDGLSVDLNHESREEDNGSSKLGENGHHHNTPVDAILDLQDPLGSFEEERMSILEQLKVLEEKLSALAEEEEHHIGDMKPFEQFYKENAKEFDANGLENGTSTINRVHHQEKSVNGSKPKQLLPLFDAVELDSDSELSNGIEDGWDPHHPIPKPLPTKFELERKRLAIEEEVDHLYERLHALEADREFVKHCVGSLRKGDKGVNLLQEILQHLRDLKDLELQARNVGGVC